MKRALKYILFLILTVVGTTHVLAGEKVTLNYDFSKLTTASLPNGVNYIDDTENDADGCFEDEDDGTIYMELANNFGSGVLGSSYKDTYGIGNDNKPTTAGVLYIDIKSIKPGSKVKITATIDHSYFDTEIFVRCSFTLPSTAPEYSKTSDRNNVNTTDRDIALSKTKDEDDVRTLEGELEIDDAISGGYLMLADKDENGNDYLLYTLTITYELPDVPPTVPKFNNTDGETSTGINISSLKDGKISLSSTVSITKIEEQETEAEQNHKDYQTTTGYSEDAFTTTIPSSDDDRNVIFYYKWAAEGTAVSGATSLSDLTTANGWTPLSDGITYSDNTTAGVRTATATISPPGEMSGSQILYVYAANSALSVNSSNEIAYGAQLYTKVAVTTPACWIADETTSAGGNLGGSTSTYKSGFVVSTNSDLITSYGSGSTSEALEGVTITFGGMNPTGGNTVWTDIRAYGANKGDNVDGVGTYELTTDDAVSDEDGTAYTHASESLTNSYERYYKLPARGSYVKIEPEADGVATFYVYQGGGVKYSGDESSPTPSQTEVSFCPVTLLDEIGTSIEAASITSNATLDANWSSIASTATPAEAYSMYATNLSGKSAGDAVEPFNILAADYSTNGTSLVGGSASGYIYAVASPASVAYKFNVRAGKTYFFTMINGGVGIRGINFEKSSSYSATSSKCPDEDRTFTANTWAAVVFPFTISKTQLQKVFGAGTKVSHWTKYDGSGTTKYLYFTNHYHQIIPAGEPVFICPTGTAFGGSTPTLSSVSFDNVTTEASDVTDITGTDGTTKMTGSFGESSTPNYGWFIQNGVLVQNNRGTTVAQKPGRGWLEGFTSSVANVKAAFISPFGGDTSTGIVEVKSDGGGVSNPNAAMPVYDLQGRVVATSLSGTLPRGIYIHNGQKFVVK